MRIGIITYPANNQNVGGLQLRVRRTLAALRKAGYSASAFDTWTDRVEDFDVLHVFKLHHSVLELVQVASTRRVPIVISTVLPPEFPTRVYRAAGWAWRRGLARQLQAYTLYHQVCQAACLVAVSRREAALLTRAFPGAASRIEVVPNCTDPAVWSRGDADAFCSRIGLPRGSFVLSVGRIEPNKNQLRLLEACRSQGLVPVLVGQCGVGQEDYFRACQAEVRKQRGVWLPHLKPDDTELASAYAGCGCFALVSESEIAPNSALEAGMSGARVVVTRNSLGAPEWFGEEAAYVDPRSVADIARGLRRAFDTPQRTECADRLRREFGWDNCVAKLWAIYNSLPRREPSS